MLMGRKVWLEKKPIPPIAFSGLFNLNRNGSFAPNALKFVTPPGCQKFTSSGWNPAQITEPVVIGYTEIKSHDGTYENIILLLSWPYSFISTNKSRASKVNRIQI
jgi:hypothetical protein